VQTNHKTQLHQATANAMLDTLIAEMRLKNDAALARRLAVAPPVVSKLRHGKLPVGASILISAHEESGISIADLKALAGISRSNHGH
jgi:DNA-binding transcriptional regulator YdaS (Cro superfamily)